MNWMQVAIIVGLGILTVALIRSFRRALRRDADLSRRGLCTLCGEEPPLSGISYCADCDDARQY